MRAALLSGDGSEFSEVLENAAAAAAEDEEDLMEE